jgi:hypothetical protein
MSGSGVPALKTKDKESTHTLSRASICAMDIWLWRPSFQADVCVDPNCAIIWINLL